MVMGKARECTKGYQRTGTGSPDANPDWVHVSYESTGKQRKQILRAVRKGGATSYVPYK